MCMVCQLTGYMIRRVQGRHHRAGSPLFPRGPCALYRRNHRLLQLLLTYHRGSGIRLQELYPATPIRTRRVGGFRDDQLFGLTRLGGLGVLRRLMEAETRFSLFKLNKDDPLR